MESKREGEIERVGIELGSSCQKCFSVAQIRHRLLMNDSMRISVRNNRTRMEFAKGLGRLGYGMNSVGFEQNCIEYALSSRLGV